MDDRRFGKKEDPFSLNSSEPKRSTMYNSLVSKIQSKVRESVGSNIKERLNKPESLNVTLPQKVISRLGSKTSRPESVLKAINASLIARLSNQRGSKKQRTCLNRPAQPRGDQQTCLQLGSDNEQGSFEPEGTHQTACLR